ncbi:MAG: 4-hydroxythreonine-4-phosphate dehydrogenase PdxA [Rhodospirillales bacterium]
MSPAGPQPATLPLALTMGDPAGIGGEITGSAWRQLRLCGPVFYVIGNRDWLRACEPGLPSVSIQRPTDALSVFTDALPVLDIGPCPDVLPGQPNAASAPLIIASIDRAVRDVMAGEAAALTTNPINKKLLYGAGFDFPGHTEYLAHLAGGNRHPVMMLAGPSLRVVPVSVHESLTRAIAGLTTARIVETGSIAVADLKRRFGLSAPRIAVAGLNPHAGEDGAMGTEDRDLVAPAVEALRAQGVDARGPIPPDALFTPRARSTYDLALCLYHDQALIPVKALDFDEAVNVTLGLPFIRTSPDHGTAYDIAGKGIARPDSLIAALRMAARMADVSA